MGRYNRLNCRVDCRSHENKKLYVVTLKVMPARASVIEMSLSLTKVAWLLSRYFGFRLLNTLNIGDGHFRVATKSPYSSLLG